MHQIQAFKFFQRIQQGNNVVAATKKSSRADAVSSLDISISLETQPYFVQTGCSHRWKNFSTNVAKSLACIQVMHLNALNIPIFKKAIALRNSSIGGKLPSGHHLLGKLELRRSYHRHHHFFFFLDDASLRTATLVKTASILLFIKCCYVDAKFAGGKSF